MTARAGRWRRWLGLAVVMLAIAATSDRASAVHQTIPARIVSTSPSITETLFALGLGDRVVGVSNYCWYPPSVKALPKVGTFLEPDVEIIARLKADLVIVNRGPNATARQLEALRLRHTVVEPGSLDGVFTTIRTIAAAAGVPDRGAALVTDLTGRLDRVKAAVAGRTPRKVLMIVGRQSGTLSDIVAVGAGSYLHDIAALAGGVNVLSGRAPQYARISMESVISLGPEIIIDVGEMSASLDDSERRRQTAEALWKRQTLVRAVREGGVHVTHEQAFVVPGPRIVTVAEMMANWFHGVRRP